MGCTSSASSTPVCRHCEEVAGNDFFDKYKLGIKLGRGAFAQVRVAIKISSQALRPDQGAVQPKSERAVKILDLRSKDNDEPSMALQRGARKEATVWQAVGTHPNCVRLHDVFFDTTLCWMVMEKCQSGLLQALERKQELTERELGEIFSQMLSGLAHCHHMKVVHRDVKPDNYMVGGQNGEVIKLCDFGLSAMMPRDPATRMTGVFGTAPFMCPEMLAGSCYDEKADVWSMGVIAYALLFGSFPYMPKQPSSKAMKQAIVDATLPPSFVPASKATGPNAAVRSASALSLTKALLCREPDERPSAEGALRMDWMRSAAQGRHQLDMDLPSLRPMLHASKKVGAFEVRDPARAERADAFLNSMQMERLGVPLPTTPAPGSEQALPKPKATSSDNGSNSSTTVSSGRSAGMSGSSK